MQELSGAFNRAMVLESLPEELKASDIGTEVLMAFATTVAYKVFLDTLLAINDEDSRITGMSTTRGLSEQPPTVIAGSVLGLG